MKYAEIKNWKSTVTAKKLVNFEITQYYREKG